MRQSKKQRFFATGALERHLGICASAPVRQSLYGDGATGAAQNDVVSGRAQTGAGLAQRLTKSGAENLLETGERAE